MSRAASHSRLLEPSLGLVKTLDFRDLSVLLMQVSLVE